MSTTLAIKKTESISDLLNLVHDLIVRRAYEISGDYGHISGRDLDNWLAAEHELFWKPPLELTEKDDEFNLCVAVPGLAPKDIEVEITREHLLVRASSRHEHIEGFPAVHVCEFESGDLFRSIRFPKAIIPDKATAECKNGMLHVNAPIALEAEVGKIELRVA